MPLTHLAMLFSSLVAINYPESRGPAVLLWISWEEEEKGDYQLNIDRTFRCEGSSWDIAGTDVNTPEQKASISLNKARVCGKRYLRRYKLVAANCDRPGASRMTFLILLFSR